MKAKTLSIREPWAWLIANGFKDVENRNWYTKERGLILLHASKTFDQEGYNWVNYQFPKIQMPKTYEFKLGGIVGAAELVRCVTKHDSPWFFGKYGFVFEGAYELPFMQCRGYPKFFEVEYHG